jgi:CysZ protein
VSTRTITPSPVSGVANSVGQFVFGVGLWLRGFVIYVRNPRLMLLGLLPAAVTGALFLAALVALAVASPQLADALTPFADEWTGWLQTLVRASVILALLGITALVGVLVFTGVTLAIGEPFYERISEWVEDRCGGVVNPAEVSWLRSLRWSISDSIRTDVLSAAVGVPLFIAGFLPVVGQTVVPALGAALGGWLLALKLTAGPFGRRGRRLADRRQALRGVRMATLGFGVTAFLAFLVPLGAILFTPAAVAGATLLTRHALGEPTDELGEPADEG